MHSYHAYLHRQALTISETYRKTEAELLDILQKIDKQRVYRRLKYPSLFAYATDALKLSEGVAYAFIQVARKAREVPELKKAIHDGELSISKAKRVVSVLTPTNQNQILTMAKTLPKRTIEKEVARLNPKQAVPETTRYVSENRLALQLGISEELMKKLQQAQDILSTKSRRAVSLEEVLVSLTQDYLDRHDPMEKAKRVQQCPGTVTKAASPSRSNHVPASIRHAVMLKDKAQCSFVDEKGRRCEERRWLEMHHKLPRGQGGGHDADNLTLLCAGHHKTV